MNNWPRWATEQVTLAPPESAWSERGERECRLLDKALAGWLLAQVEHVGSTAVPGLTAKPILDLQAAVADLDECALPIAEVLAHHGWEYVPPDLDHRPWRRFFVQVINDHRSGHLHVMTLGCPRWNQQLAFRDALRADQALLARYAALKQTLAARHADDRESYSAAKADFVLAALEALR